MEAAKKIQHEKSESPFNRSCSKRILKARERALTSKEICLERIRAYKKAMIQYENEPMIIKRARMLDEYLKSKTVFILEDELIVGNVTSKIRGSTIAPEMISFIDAELDDPVKDFEARPFEKFVITPEQRKELREDIIPFFRGKTLADFILPRIDGEVKEKACGLTASDPHNPVIGDFNLFKDFGHQMVNYEKVLYKGLNGIRKDVEWYMAESAQPYVHYGREEKRDFYQAVLIVLDAAMAYAKRYEALAREMAESEKDKTRAKELQRIARNCEHVPANPARNWEEAIQSLWMIQALVQIENFHITNCPARIDQYLFPFYKKSIIDEKTMARDEALELLECYFVKLNENAIICDYLMATLAPGQALSLTITIGGQTREGKDACNEVTTLCLEAEEHIGLAQPEIAMRLWDGTPERYLIKAAEVLRMGRGKPKFISDRTAIRMAEKGNPGLPEADYREYAVGGCTELTLPHIEMLHSWEGVCIVTKILELVMFNGRCTLCDKQIGPATGDPRMFKSMSDFLRAYGVQQNYWMRLMVRAIKAVKEGQSERVMIPFCSALTEGPLQKGFDIAQGGTWYNNCGIYLAGLADTSDSLAVIDKLIYRDKKITWDQLLTAIKDNWQGHENLRQLCIHDVPKYGNDDDFADDWAVWVMNSWYDCVDAINDQKNLAPTPYRDGLYVGSGIIGQSNVGFGMAISATPNGRIHPRPLAECNSPFPGVDRCGPTGVIKSISKLPAYRFAMGGVLNLKLSPELLQTENGIYNFVAFLRSVEELGIYQTQFNVISSDTLRKAMEEPEQYRDLLVRVASYCVYFVECTEEQQLDIISRTEHQGW